MARDKPNDAAVNPLPPTPDYDDPYDADRHRLYSKQGRYGVMYAPDYEWDTRRCIEEAYGDSYSTPRSRRVEGKQRRALQFHTDWLSVATARSHITAIPSYNRFDPDATADAMRRFPEDARVVLGREGSPVMYVWTVRAGTVMDALDQIPHDDEHAGDGPFAPAGPDELGAMPAPTVATYPVLRIGHPRETLSDGRAYLVRAWWG